MEDPAAAGLPPQRRERGADRTSLPGAYGTDCVVLYKLPPPCQGNHEALGKSVAAAARAFCERLRRPGAT